MEKKLYFIDFYIADNNLGGTSAFMMEDCDKGSKSNLYANIDSSDDFVLEDGSYDWDGFEKWAYPILKEEITRQARIKGINEDQLLFEYDIDLEDLEGNKLGEKIYTVTFGYQGNHCIEFNDLEKAYNFKDELIDEFNKKPNVLSTGKEINIYVHHDLDVNHRFDRCLYKFMLEE